MERINNEKEYYTCSSSGFIDIFKMIAYSSIGVLIFFIPIQIDGQTKTILYHIAYKLQLKASDFLIICTTIYISLGCLKELYTNYKRKEGKSNIYTYLRIFSIFIIISIFYNKGKFVFIEDNVVFLIKETILTIVTILPLSAIFMPFLMEYGLLDIVESYCHKFMKNTFKVSGKTVINILVYIFTDCFCGYFMTNKLYKEGKIRENEACFIILNFSILSYTMMNYVCDEFSLNRYSFLFFVVLIIFFNNMVLCRIYPLNKKSKSYYIKTNYKETVHKNNKLKKGVKKYIENKKNKNIFIHIINNLEEVLNLLVILVPNIVIAIYIGSFIINSELVIDILKQLFYPISSLLKIQNYNQLNTFIINIFYNDIVGIDLAYKHISEVTKLLMGVIVSTKCISICTSIIYISNSSIPVRKRDFIICYFEKIFITIFIYFAIYYFYIGYIR